MTNVRQYELDTFYRLSGETPSSESCRIIKITGFSWALPQAVYGHIIDIRTGQVFEASGETWSDTYVVFARHIGDPLTSQEVQEIIHAMHERLNVFFKECLPNVSTRYIREKSHE